MRKVRTLVTLFQSGDWDADLRNEVPPEIDLEFLERGRALSDALPGVEVFYGIVPEEDLPRADRLRWVQLNSTGADTMMYEGFVKSGILLTTIGAAITTTVAEHALALLFALARNLHLQRDLQRAGKWQPVTGADLSGMKLGIIGFGRIGRAIASRAHGFEMDIVAIDALPADKPDYIRELWGLDRLPDLLRRSEAVVCAVPKTPATYGMISKAQLDMMPRGSYLVNISRGGVIDETALVEAVRSGRIAGAGIDVTDVEPCPPDSPLWGEPGVLLTPHSAGFSRGLKEKKIRWFVGNLKRYVRGEPLQGLVDPRRGF